MRVPAWKKSFELLKRELEAILEKEVLSVSIPEFPTVRRMTLGMNSPLVVPSPFARAAAVEQQKGFTYGWEFLFIGYTAAVYFHTSEIKKTHGRLKEDERLDAPEVRGTRSLENA